MLCAVRISQFTVMRALLQSGLREDAYAIKTLIRQLELPPLPALRQDGGGIDRMHQMYRLLGKLVALAWLQMLYGEWLVTCLRWLTQTSNALWA
jgi:hypothetical protein